MDGTEMIGADLPADTETEAMTLAAMLIRPDCRFAVNRLDAADFCDELHACCFRVISWCYQKQKRPSTQWILRCVLRAGKKRFPHDKIAADLGRIVICGGRASELSRYVNRLKVVSGLRQRMLTAERTRDETLEDWQNWRTNHAPWLERTS